jgi:hypothetical protein
VPDPPDKQPIADLGALLSRFGISSDFAQKVRFRGPVGKLALVGVFCLVCLGGVGMRSPDRFVEALCASLATLVVLGIAAGILWYSHVHPNEATLEGMEAVVYQQHKAWAASKEKGRFPELPDIPDPAGSPPQLNPPEVEDQ